MTDREKKKLKKKLLSNIKDNQAAISGLDKEISLLLRKIVNLQETKNELNHQIEILQVQSQRVDKEEIKKTITNIETDKFGTIRGMCEGREVQWNWAVNLFHFSDTRDYIFNHIIKGN